MWNKTCENVVAIMQTKPVIVRSPTMPTILIAPTMPIHVWYNNQVWTQSTRNNFPAAKNASAHHAEWSLLILLTEIPSHHPPLHPPPPHHPSPQSPLPASQHHGRTRCISTLSLARKRVPGNAKSAKQTSRAYRGTKTAHIEGVGRHCKNGLWERTKHATTVHATYPSRNIENTLQSHMMNTQTACLTQRKKANRFDKAQTKCIKQVSFEDTSKFQELAEELKEGGVEVTFRGRPLQISSSWSYRWLHARGYVSRAKTNKRKYVLSPQGGTRPDPGVHSGKHQGIAVFKHVAML